MAIPLLHLPLFILTIDWGRWFASIYICLIGIILYLVYSNFAPLTIVIEKFSAKLSNSKFTLFIMIILILYLASLGKFEAPGQIGVANKIFELINEAISTLMK